MSADEMELAVAAGSLSEALEIAARDILGDEGGSITAHEPTCAIDTEAGAGCTCTPIVICIEPRSPN